MLGLTLLGAVLRSDVAAGITLLHTSFAVLVAVADVLVHFRYCCTYVGQAPWLVWSLVRQAIARPPFLSVEVTAVHV